MERMHINFDLRMSIVSNISERCKTYPFKIYYVKDSPKLKHLKIWDDFFLLLT